MNDEKIKSDWEKARASIEEARASIEKTKRAQREHRESRENIEKTLKKHMAETGLRARAKRQGLIQQTVTCLPGFGKFIYIYSIFEFQSTALPHCFYAKAYFVLMLLLCFSMSLTAPLCSLDAPSMLPRCSLDAPSMLPCCVSMLPRCSF